MSALIEELEAMLAEHREGEREKFTYAELMALVMKHKQPEQVRA